MNDDLPQFDALNLTGGWAELTLAFDLAPLSWGIPIALQIWNREGPRVLVTGLVTSTEDVLPPASTDNDRPIRSIIYFQDAERVVIEWSKVQVVLAMSATPATTTEEGAPS